MENGGAGAGTEGGHQTVQARASDGIARDKIKLGPGLITPMISTAAMAIRLDKNIATPGDVRRRQAVGNV
jgi:hypothetical protein